MQIERELANGLGVAGLKGGFHRVQEIGAQHPFLVT